ncbi:unnamed protein product [Angiostrongylus costaricensis]|uniref:Sema domain-containing protein n=1 Tax=Angiostrongylus costaricensis TaxID=334426 RepID=A0A158PEJ4_ANGCS|nr:unnamed protein product [Angiostrongylus costaricensis]
MQSEPNLIDMSRVIFPVEKLKVMIGKFHYHIRKKLSEGERRKLREFPRTKDGYESSWMVQCRLTSTVAIRRPDRTMRRHANSIAARYQLSVALTVLTSNHPTDYDNEARRVWGNVAMRGIFRLLIGFFHFHNVLIASSQHFYYSKTTINNVVIDDGKIYVGSVNKLVVLSTDELLPLHSLTTGPINDSVLCSFDGSSCLKNAVLRDTDNHNKVLQVLPDGVLHCGSVRQGICSMHSLRDLSMVSSGDVPVASILPTASCVSLVLSPTRLAVAVSYSGDSPYRDPFPAVAVRELPSYLVLNAGSLEGEAAVFLRAELRLSFDMQYLTIFHHEHYVFIATVQSQNTRQMRSLSRVTKLLRFCDNDTR